ncbi:MAG TPA: alpha/beta hydrolase [Ktedonobacterales bacterium]
MFDKPLKRLTSGPQRRRPANNRRLDDPPNDYDLHAPDAQSPRSRPRWTAPGAYLRRNDRGQSGPRPDDRGQSGPRQYDARPDDPRQNEPRVYDPRQNESRRQPMGGADDRYGASHSQSDAFQGQWGGEPQRPPDGGGGDRDARGMSADVRWQQPDWLSGGPPPAQSPADMPPPLPQMRNAGIRQESPLYQPPEEDPQQQTDYRATSARAALWASRTPSYQADQPAQMAPREVGEEERGYFEAYNTRRTPASLAHAEASMSRTQVGEYVPGATSEVERLRKNAKSTGRTFGPAPYFWELVKKPRPASPPLILLFWLTSLLVFASALLTAGYAGVSIYAASQLGHAPQVEAKGTPASAGLSFQPVVFVSRTDHVLLRGWFIPGVTSTGAQTTSKAIIMVHGPGSNRADSAVGQLALSEALAKAGFAVLTFDLRDSGASASAPTTMGYLEARDVLGAVDFLRTGPMPYPKLERPKVIGAWGVSTGAVALLMAAAQEPALGAVVADSAFARALPIVQRDLPAQTHLSHAFTPGIILAEQVMYGADYNALAPVNVVAQIAPRPLLFIQGADDTYIPSGDLDALTQAAQQGKGAKVTSWSVEGAKDGQAYHTDPAAYVAKVVAFFDASLAPAK